MLFQSILLQITPHTYLVWDDVFFYLFLGLMIYTIISNFLYLKLMRKRVADGKLMQEQHVARVDLIRKDHNETLERIRVEMLKREEERARQWMESEKETLHVLNGVSILLDLNEKIEKNESEKIIKILEEIREKVEKITSKD
jgi:hypothetical protein